MANPLIQFDIDSILGRIYELTSRLGAKFAFGVAAVGLITYLAIAGYLTDLGLSISLVVVGGIVAITVLFFIFRRQQEKDGSTTNGGPTTPPPVV